MCSILEFWSLGTSIFSYTVGCLLKFNKHRAASISISLSKASLLLSFYLLFILLVVLLFHSESSFELYVDSFLEKDGEVRLAWNLMSASCTNFFCFSEHFLVAFEWAGAEILCSWANRVDYIFADMFLKLFKLLMIRISSINNCLNLLSTKNVDQ